MEDVGMEILLKSQCILEQKGYLGQCRIPVPWRSLGTLLHASYRHSMLSFKNILLLVSCTTVVVTVVRLCTCSILMKKFI